MAVDIVNKLTDKMEYIFSMPTNKYIFQAVKSEYFFFWIPFVSFSIVYFRRGKFSCVYKI